MAFRVEIKNFGPVPGLKFHTKSRLTLDGIEGKHEEEGDAIPSTIFPGHSIYLSGNIWNADDYKAIMDNKKLMEIETTIWYDGPPARSYTECEKHWYKPELAAFVELGMSCPSQ